MAAEEVTQTAMPMVGGPVQDPKGVQKIRSGGKILRNPQVMEEAVATAMIPMEMMTMTINKVRITHEHAAMHLRAMLIVLQAGGSERNPKRSKFLVSLAVRLSTSLG